jgi:ferredoxin
MAVETPEETPWQTAHRGAGRQGRRRWKSQQPAPEGDTVKVKVDPERCQGHTLCSMIAPESFRLSDIDGSSSAIDEVVPAEREDQVREAAQSCPEQAILISDEM